MYDSHTELVKLVQQAIRQVAGMDQDFAQVRNNMGFSAYDVEFGHSLAEAPRWSNKQFAMALKMVHKYRRQIDESLLEHIFDLESGIDDEHVQQTIAAMQVGFSYYMDLKSWFKINEHMNFIPPLMFRVESLTDKAVKLKPVALSPISGMPDDKLIAAWYPKSVIEYITDQEKCECCLRKYNINSEEEASSHIYCCDMKAERDAQHQYNMMVDEGRLS